MLHKVSKHDRPRRRVQAEENAVLDVQFAILDILRKEGIAKDELAARLGVTKARVSQLFAAGANPTLKQVARIFDALDRAIKINDIRYSEDAQQFERRIELPAWMEATPTRSQWELTPFVEAANENCYCEQREAA